MKNFRETLNNALMIGGLVTSVGGAVDAVRTVSLPEVRQIPAITQELQDEFHVREECVGFGPEMPICNDIAEWALSPLDAEQITTEFQTELAKRTEDANNTVNRRLPLDTAALVIGGEITVFTAMRKNKK